MSLRSLQLPTRTPLAGTGVLLFGAGHVINQSGSPVRHARWAKCTTPHLVVAGEGWVRTPRGETRLQAGDLFCPMQGEFIEYADSESAPWEYYWASLTGDGAPALVEACGFSLHRQWFAITKWSPLRKAWEELLDSLTTLGDPRSLMPYARLLALLEGIRSGGPKANEPDEQPLGLLQRAEAILDNGTRTLNVEELADALGVHRATLYHTVNKALGTTPVQWLAQRRHDHAKRLLAETNLKIEAVADAGGYGDVKYFHRAFRLLEGMTPTNYRRQWLRAGQDGGGTSP